MATSSEAMCGDTAVIVDFDIRFVNALVFSLCIEHLHSIFMA
jgi:hypothetical protein